MHLHWNDPDQCSRSTRWKWISDDSAMRDRIYVSEQYLLKIHLPNIPTNHAAKSAADCPAVDATEHTTKSTANCPAVDATKHATKLSAEWTTFLTTIQSTHWTANNSTLCTALQVYDRHFS